MNATNQSIIALAAQKARLFMAEYGNLLILDTQYTAHSAEITQAEIDGVPAFAEAGLTVAQLAAAVYALKMIKSQIDTVDLDAFVKVSQL